MRRIKISKMNSKLIVYDKSEVKMRSEEIILIALLVIGSFLIAEFIVNHFIFIGALQRFIMRVGFQAQFFVLIYLFFDSRDNSRRVRLLERRFMRERKVRIEKYGIRKK